MKCLKSCLNVKSRPIITFKKCAFIKAKTIVAIELEKVGKAKFNYFKIFIQFFFAFMKDFLLLFFMLYILIQLCYSETI